MGINFEEHNLGDVIIDVQNLFGRKGKGAKAPHISLLYSMG